ncbi:MAG TPA: hypothetical protein VMV10_09810 [Pirellulales bacterium]|nr:hypothetical protein [Pirellulales bacterium]
MDEPNRVLFLCTGNYYRSRLAEIFFIIGVAKTRFQNATAIEITRGESKVPLFITAVGIDPAEAAGDIRKMHGSFRVPTLTKRADQLARA